MEVDVGIQVPNSVAAADGLVLSSTPAGRAAHAILYGDYTEIPRVHQAIHRWCAERPRRPLLGGLQRLARGPGQAADRHVPPADVMPRSVE